RKPVSRLASSSLLEPLTSKHGSILSWCGLPITLYLRLYPLSIMRDERPDHIPRHVCAAFVYSDIDPQFLAGTKRHSWMTQASVEEIYGIGILGFKQLKAVIVDCNRALYCGTDLPTELGGIKPAIALTAD